MRSARILFAATATAAALAVTTPGAHALTTGDWGKDDSAHSQKRDHDKPHGGVHTGGGALTTVNADDWSKPGSETKDHGKDWSKEHDKPKGGMHTGGGGLASSGTNVTGAVVLAGGLAAFVLYRRRKAAGANA
ncbi:hypothetical protein ACFXGT_35570 [Streptomyces sp. NPDC059352]|uniref:hypothetical protein n=1 Tax=Streptomyces sp. NPDC059352 TaxID=3346810 RepID=UPI00367AA2AD